MAEERTWGMLHIEYAYWCIDNLKTATPEGFAVYLKDFYKVPERIEVPTQEEEQLDFERRVQAAVPTMKFHYERRHTPLPEPQYYTRRREVITWLKLGALAAAAFTALVLHLLGKI